MVCLPFPRVDAFGRMIGGMTISRAVFVFIFLGLAAAFPFCARAGVEPSDGPDDRLVSGVAGNYLAGRYAQRVQDWDRASEYLSRTLTVDPDNPELVRGAMILAMGAGQVEKAVSMARRVPVGDSDAGALAILFLALDDFARDDHERVLEHLRHMPGGGLTTFIVPLLHGWAAAGQGRYDLLEKPSNALQVWHAALIASFLKTPERIAGLLESPQALKGLPSAHLETLADVCARAGLKDKAKALYRDALVQRPSDPNLAARLEDLENGRQTKEPFPVKTARQGAALAFFDMAGLLASESSDDSARVFLRMALHLDPDMRPARDLLVRLAARNGRYEEAIVQARALASGPKPQGEDVRFLAGLLEEAGQRDEALSLLGRQVEKGDLAALVQIGDLHRRAEAWKEALKTYDRAFAAYETHKKTPEWSLYYARGMMRERMGLWDGSEADLKAALALAPDHPYILNYLGYGWADQGKNLAEAVAMLRKAAALRPSDGYIADSLGWALYRSGRYEEALAPMEKAVELVPYDSLINEHLGDVYWQAGRRREARFQWRRARNFTEDPALAGRLESKIQTGLVSKESPAH